MSRPLRTLPEHFVTLSELHEQTAKCLRRMGKRGGPMVITDNEGMTAGFLLNPWTFYSLVLRAQYLEEVMEEGLPDAEARGVHARAAVAGSPGHGQRSD